MLKFTALEPLSYSLYHRPKTRPPSLSSATFVIVPKPGSVVVEDSLRGVVAREADEATPEVAEANFKELVAGAADNKEAMVVTILEEDVEVREVDDALDGRITTNPSATGTPQSTSKLIGRCLKRSTLFAWPS